MKKFYELSKTPLIIAIVASLLFCVDCLLGPVFVEGAGFMWVAFASWTITFGISTKDKVKLLIGNVIGFLAATGMIYVGQIFDTTVIGIGIASLIGVFLFNGLVMYFDNFKKFWLSSITGIFMGIWLTFSGLGQGLGPDTWGDAFLTLGIILTYSALGCICAFASVFFMNKWKKPAEKKTSK